MARPSLNQLAPTRTDGTLDRTFEVFYDGNADLEPVEADQADLSIEWYFDDKSVLSGAVFWKDLDGFITYGAAGERRHRRRSATSAAPATHRCCTTCSARSTATRPKVYGSELGVQHFFENGFGLRANYTYTDTQGVSSTA